ncbi:MAG: RNA-binding protein [Fimbriimonadia bacterium]|jgi:RNA recognition motif-containing protein
MNIYVGNLSYDMTEAQLREIFESYGEVTSCRIIEDKFTGRSKGFGFVEMSDKAQAEAAISGLNGKDFSGRPLTVNEARPKTEMGRGGGGRNRW